MKSRGCLSLCMFMLFLSCSSQNEEERSGVNEMGEKTMAVTLMDLGTKIFPVDIEADFSYLVGLQLTKLEDDREYLSFFNLGKRLIYLYDYESGTLINKIRLDSEGPNKVPFPIFSFEYFFQSSDSIFINSLANGYYLIDSNANVLNKFGDTSAGLNFAGNKLSFDAATYFSNDKIYGAYKTTGQNVIEGLSNTRATLDLENNLEISPIHAREIVYEFDKVLDIRRQEKSDGKNLLTMSRQFAKNGEFLFVTTPISDSIKVFKGDSLVETLYGTVENFELPNYREYINLVQIKHVPGEVSRVTEPVQPSQYVNMFVDPQGRYLYRVFVTGTKSVTHPVSGVERPSPIGAVLLVVDLNTNETFQMELPVDEIEVRVPISREVFVSNKGIHFKVKGQDNEDQVAFRIFGFSSDLKNSKLTKCDNSGIS